MPSDPLRGAAAVVGLGITPQGKVFDTNAIGFAVDALKLALEDAGLGREDLDGLLVNPGLAWSDLGMGSFQLQQAMGLRNLRLSATMNLGGATACAMIQHATQAIAATTGPLAAANSPAVKLVAGAVFGVALTLVVMAGSELFTGLNMVMLQGLAAGTVNALEVLFVWISSLVGNLIGALAFSWLINAGGTLSAKTPAGKLGPGEAFIESLVKAKNAAPGAQLFWRALACNMLVCLAVWMAARTRSDDSN